MVPSSKISLFFHPHSRPFSQAILPSTMVITGQPLQFHPVNGVFFPFDKKVSGLISISSFQIK